MGIALDVPKTTRLSEDGRRELAELRSGHGPAPSRPDVHVVARLEDEVRRWQRIEVVPDDRDSSPGGYPGKGWIDVVQPGEHPDVGVLDTDTRDELEVAQQGKLEQSVTTPDLLGSGVVVGRLR